MKKNGNIIKTLQSLLFVFVTFFIFGVINVNAETVKTVDNLDDFNSLMSFYADDGVDVIKLNADITATDTFYWYIKNNVTLDLNGFSINGSREIMFKIFYYGDYTVKVINSSNTRGSINHTYTPDDGKTFYLDNGINGKNKTLYIDGIEFNESGRGRTIICFDKNSIDSLIVKNVNAKAYNFSSGFDNYKFSNIVLKPMNINSSLYLASGNADKKVKDILGEDQEIYYQLYNYVGGSKIGEGIADENLSINDLWTNNVTSEDDNAIIVRYKNGFSVSNVDLNETYGYTATAKEISIKNRGTSDLQIKNVSVDSSDFVIVNGSETNLSAGDTDTTWKIKAKSGLSKGVYTATITVTDINSNTYTSTVTLNVGAKNLSALGIGSINSTIDYGDEYEPTIIGTTELGVGDYVIKYAYFDGGIYKNIDYKPVKSGKYQVIISVTNENYTASDVSVFFEIVAKRITPTVNAITDQTYTGEQITPNVSVGYGSETFAKDTGYTVEYGTNVDVGEGKVIIKPVIGGNFTWDDEEVTFNIVAKSLTDSNVSLIQTSYRHTGSEIKPEPVVKDGKKTLLKGTDYELSYSDNINIGNGAEVKITGKGNYKGEVIKSFSIIDKDPQVISFNEESVTKTYGDSDFVITANHTKGDGNVKYTSSNTDVAIVDEITGKVTIKNVGIAIIKATANSTSDYAEASAIYTLKVNKKEISYVATVGNKAYDNTLSATISNIEFSGLVGSDSLTENIDYVATALFVSANVGNDLDVNVSVILENTLVANNYKLVSSNYVAKANITGKAILDSWVIVNNTITYTYDGTAKEPNVTVKESEGEMPLTLTEGTHYTVEYSNNINAGLGKIKISGMGNYSGVILKEFTINKKPITPVVEDIANVIYNGNYHTPEVVVKDDSTPLVKNTDYIVEYDNHLRAGSAVAIIKAKDNGNYTFTDVLKSFTIDKYEIKASDVTLEYTSTIYDGNSKRPTVTVKMGNEVIAPIEYNVDYLDNMNVGTATVKVKIKSDSDDYMGEVTKTFEIVDKTLLTISGINNQQVTYTGNPVVLVGDLIVSNGIDPILLTEKWYKGTTEISRPTDVGMYKVVYSYEDATYIGSLTVDIEITKKESIVPFLNTYSAMALDKLSSILLPNGFKWVNDNETILAGNKEYNATYTTNNDTVNYTTENVLINVYGKSRVNLNTSVNGTGGTISAGKNNILEGTTETIIFTPNVGFEISKVEVNGIDKTNSVVDGRLNIVVRNSDVNVVVTYKVIQYTITINDVENVFINPVGIIKVDYNSSKVFTIMAELGYNLVSVKVNGVERINDMIFDELTLDNILSDTEIVVIVERNIYEVVEGANQTYIINKDKKADFKMDVESAYFERGGSVYVDGVLIDPSNYTSKDGLIITLKKEYLDNLAEGIHTLKILFTNGEANTTFVIAKLPYEENPYTGDNLVFYILAGIISTIGLTGCGVYIYKRKQTN